MAGGLMQSVSSAFAWHHEIGLHFHRLAKEILPGKLSIGFGQAVVDKALLRRRGIAGQTAMLARPALIIGMSRWNHGILLRALSQETPAGYLIMVKWAGWGDIMLHCPLAPPALKRGLS
jgi:hypothetical protein